MREPVPGGHLDQFEIVDVLARSGMATLFRARDTTDGRTVLKVPHLEYASDLVFHERFRREEQLGQRLDHVAITRVLEPRDKSRLYLVMEYVPGESLRSRLARDHRLPVAGAVRIAVGIADALAVHDPRAVEVLAARARAQSGPPSRTRARAARRADPSGERASHDGGGARRAGRPARRPPQPHPARGRGGAGVWDADVAAVAVRSDHQAAVR